MKRTGFGVSFYCRDSKVGKQGTASIEMSIVVSGTRVFIALPRKMQPKDFSKDMASRRSNDTKEFCALWRSKADKAILDLMEAGKSICASTVKDCILNGLTSVSRCSDIFKSYLSLLAEKTKGGLSLGTYRKYELSFASFTDIVGDKDINDITASDIERYIAVVSQTHKAATVRGYSLRVKSAFIQAKQDGTLKSDPWTRIKIRNPRQKLDIITPDEYARIRDKRFSIPRLEKVRRLFVLGCNCGLAYCDMMGLSEKDIQEKDGITYIEKDRQKTGVSFISVILEDGLEILRTLVSLDDVKMSNQKVNSYLKEIQDICGIEHTLTFHKSRHYYCTALLRKGIKPQIVQQCMGHTKIQMTMHYTHLVQDDVLDAFK